MHASPVDPPICPLVLHASRVDPPILLTANQCAPQNKEDLKTVALGTSKINYLDPRITVAW